MNLNFTLLIALYILILSTPTGKPDENEVSISFISRSDSGVLKYELARVHNKHPFNTFLHYCNQTGCGFISKDESITVINSSDPVILTMRGSIINFHDPVFTANSIDEALFKATQLHTGNHPEYFSNSFVDFRINLARYIPNPKPSIEDFIPKPANITPSKFNYKITSTEIDESGFNIKYSGSEGDIIELKVNENLKIYSIKRNGNHIPIRFSEQISKPHNKYTFADHGTGIEAELRPTSLIYECEIRGTNFPSYFWHSDFKLTFNEDIIESMFMTVCVPDLNIAWTGPPHSLGNFFIDKSVSLVFCHIDINHDISIATISPYNKNVNLNLAIKRSFQSFLELHKTKNKIRKISTDSYYKLLKNSIKVNPQNSLNIDFSDFYTMLYQIKEPHTNPDYDLEIQFPGKIFLNREQRVCKILINKESGQLDYVINRVDPTDIQIE